MPKIQTPLSRRDGCASTGRSSTAIVTQNGDSTDITIQGGSGSPVPDYDRGYSEWGDHRFDRHRMEERFSRGADDYSGFRASSEREAFKQQILDRMHNRFLS